MRGGRSGRMTPKRRSVVGKLILMVILLLVAVRVSLPWIVKTYVNKVLSENPEYDGHVSDVDIALIRGAYAIDGITITKRGGTAPIPFLDIDRIDLSVQWKALFKGSIVAEIEVLRPRVNFVNGPSKEDKQAGGGVDWREQVKKLVPLDINRFAVLDGEVHFADFSSSPKVDIYLKDLQVEALNLTNSEDLAGSLVATVTASGRPMGLGVFALNASLDPYATLPTFDLNASIKQLPLPALNSFISAYGKFDVEKGTMEIYTELAAEQGRFTGYVKPVLTDVQVVSLKKEIERDHEGPLRIAWETLVGAGRGLLENDKKDQIAAKIPLSGSVAKPEVDAWSTIGSTLRNAFIQALFRGLDGQVDMSDVDRGTADDRPKGGLFGKKDAR
jgi:hypothetical protein